jgi:hypothetical protein
MLTTEEAYAMGCQYRYNIRAHGREDESLRNTLATLWMEKYRPDLVARLIQDIRVGDTLRLAGKGNISMAG